MLMLWAAHPILLKFVKQSSSNEHNAEEAEHQLAGRLHHCSLQMAAHDVLHTEHTQHTQNPAEARQHQLSVEILVVRLAQTATPSLSHWWRAWRDMHALLAAADTSTLHLGG
jgi:hypothetical protein